MNSIQVNIKIGEGLEREKLIAELSLLGVDGFEERDDELICFYREHSIDSFEINNKFSNSQLEHSKSVVKEENWNAEWERNFTPVTVEDFCTIRAEFHKTSLRTIHEIVITPKMSFGTGHHATTYLMVQAMSDLDFHSKIVADFGTGTGVLSILSEKMGGAYLWAIDNDNWSIENAKENIEANNCRNIEIEQADAFKPTQQFDIILANINKNTILSNVDGLVSGLRIGGSLLVSGLLATDENEVKLLFQQNNLTHLKTVEKDNWICMLFSYSY